MEFNDLFFYTLGIMASITTVLTQGLNKMFGVKTSSWKQVMSFIAAALITAVGCYTNVLYFASFTAFNASTAITLVLMVICTGLVSNGIYDIPAIKNFLNSLTFKQSK